MFRKMRRIKQQLSQEESIAILERATCGVLAVLGDDDYPYAVPLSFVHSQGKLYFHSAKTGHKLEAIRRHDRASFCVVAQDQVVPEDLTTYYKSVVAFGRVRVLEEGEEKRRALDLLSDKYGPGEKDPQENLTCYDRVCMVELDIEHLSGKQAKELVQ